MERTDEELILAIRAGDREARGILANRYKDLVRCITRSFFLLGGDREDLVQEGMIGLMESIDGYNFSVPFKNFAGLCVRRQIINYVNSQIKKNSVFFNSVPITFGQEDEEIVKSLGGAKSPEEIYLEGETLKIVKSEIENKLSALEIKILRSYLKGLSYSELAQKLNLTEKQVDNGLQRIRKKLKDIKR